MIVSSFGSAARQGRRKFRRFGLTPPGGLVCMTRQLRKAARCRLVKALRVASIRFQLMYLAGVASVDVVIPKRANDDIEELLVLEAQASMGDRMVLLMLGADCKTQTS